MCPAFAQLRGPHSPTYGGGEPFVLDAIRALRVARRGAVKARTTEIIAADAELKSWSP
jgi:hypothetical protein